MTKLDQRGDIAVAEIVVYIPILILSVILVIRNGFTRQAGWIYLVILSLSEHASSLVQHNGPLTFRQFEL